MAVDSNPFHEQIRLHIPWRIHCAQANQLQSQLGERAFLTWK